MDAILTTRLSIDSLTLANWRVDGSHPSHPGVLIWLERVLTTPLLQSVHTGLVLRGADGGRSACVLFVVALGVAAPSLD